eukprot:Ihof_evm5s46 gene=Ihof_evmTU5s46
MKFFYSFLLLSVAALASGSAEETFTTTQIGIKKRVEGCKEFAAPGDFVSIHYTGSLLNGEVFDTSLKRGEPFSFTLGNGQVIKGWEKGIPGICVGEKRKLKIPYQEAYGEAGSPPSIP